MTPLRITNSAARNGSYGAAAAVVRLSDDPTTAYPLSASHVMAPLGARPGDPIRAAADCPPIRRCDVVARLVTWTGLVEDFGFPNVINAAIARLEPGLNPRFDLSDLVGFRFAQQHPAIGAAFRLPWAGVGSSGAVRDPGRDCVITWFDPHSPDPANPAELDYGMADLIVCDAMEHEGDSGAAVVDGVTGEVVGIVAGQPFPEPGEPVLSALSPIGAVATHPQWGGWRLEPWSSVPAVQPTAPGAWDPLTVLAKTLWAEAAIDRGLGMTAVAWVVMNRAKTGRLRWGRTPKDVCLMPSQFSCWNWGTSSRTKLEQCRRLIRACTPPRQSLQKRFPVFYPGPIRRWEPAFTMRLQPCRRHHPGRTATAPAAPSGGRYSLMTCNRGRKWRAARKPAASRLWY